MRIAGMIIVGANNIENITNFLFCFSNLETFLSKILIFDSILSFIVELPVRFLEPVPSL